VWPKMENMAVTRKLKFLKGRRKKKKKKRNQPVHIPIY